MSTARHPQTDGLTERVNVILKMLLRCYIAESCLDWVSHLPMDRFHCNFSISEASKHSPSEVTYGFQPTTRASIFLPLTGAPAHVADRLTKLASVRDVVRELLTLSNQRMTTRSS